MKYSSQKPLEQRKEALQNFKQKKVELTRTLRPEDSKDLEWHWWQYCLVACYQCE